MTAKQLETETKELTPEDANKAKKKGGIFGDPVYIPGDSE